MLSEIERQAIMERTRGMAPEVAEETLRNMRTEDILEELERRMAMYENSISVLKNAFRQIGGGNDSVK